LSVLYGSYLFQFRPILSVLQNGKVFDGNRFAISPRVLIYIKRVRSIRGKRKKMGCILRGLVEVRLGLDR
jgi:hypothetical protein